MHILADFLNHGILPFTGRTRQLGELVGFWRSTIESIGMQLGIVVGEAGSGKSSLMEELIPLVTREGGVAVHVKLYPDSALSLAPLVARALAKTGAASGILRTAPEENLGGVAAALRRLTHLRPTLLVIEDIHLLGSDGLTEFSLLLQAMADEPIALLCPSRPLDTATYGMLENYMLREWHLPGLEREEIQHIWTEVFGAPPQESIFEAVYAATLGNPLALRSALRGVLKSGALARDPQTNLWRLAVPRDEFDQALERSVRLLSEGMAAHLTDAERSGAEQLACLGELFSRDAAAIMAGDIPEIIDRLMFKGIVAVSEIPSRPLSGSTPIPPLAFTHSLVHRRFAESATVNAGRLVQTIASGAPLYSVLPFQILRDQANPLEASCTAVEQALEKIYLIIPSLNITSDWELNDPVWHAAERLVNECSSCWEGPELILQQIAMTDARISLCIRRQHSDEYYNLARKMMELAQMYDTEPFLRRRMRAISHCHMAEFRREPAKCLILWDQAEELIQQHPWLRMDGSYPRYLARLLSTSVVVNRELMDKARDRAEELIVEGAKDKEFMRVVRRFLMPELLGTFQNKEQFEKQLGHLYDLEHGPDADPYRFVVQRMILRIYAGRLYELWGMIDDMSRRLEEIAENRALSFARVARLFLRAILGDDLEAVDREVDAMLASCPEWNLRVLRENISQYLSAAGLLRGETEWAGELVTRVGCDYPVLDTAEVLLYGMHGGEKDLHLLEMEDSSHPLLPLARVMRGEEVPYEELRRAMLEMAQEEVYEMFELLRFKAVLRATTHFQNDDRFPDMAGDMKDALHNAVEQWLQWLEGMGLWTLMESLVLDAEPILSPKEKRSWQGTIASLRNTHTLGRESRASDRVRVSMLGTIQVEKPGTEPQRLRGPRVCKFLGMLVADRMLDTPLSFREMCRLISSGDIDNDPERERKALNDAVYRLREVLGHDGVITERETSRLNTDTVEVDLLQAHRMLQETTAALREGALARALGLLMNALEIAGAEVPFPGLYDSFFEAARVEFEVRLRGALVELAKRLISEGDASGAEELLRRGFTAMPEDEEIMEQLCEVLRNMGRYTEAVRIRMRAEEA